MLFTVGDSHHDGFFLAGENLNGLHREARHQRSVCSTLILHEVRPSNVGCQEQGTINDRYSDNLSEVPDCRVFARRLHERLLYSWRISGDRCDAVSMNRTLAGALEQYYKDKSTAM